MQYESLNMVGNYVQWMIICAGAIITVRIVYIIYGMATSDDESISTNRIKIKVGKHIKALIIAASIVGIIEWIQQYFFH